MKKKMLTISCSISALIFTCVNANAMLTGGPDVLLAAPASVLDGTVTNENQQAFDEAQGVLLGAPISVDGGTIPAGAVVDSHMIFFNPNSEIEVEDFLVDWTFDNMILGVMSDQAGNLEQSSNPFLAAPGTAYPSPYYDLRGMETGYGDTYSFLGNTITVSMRVSEPGDWIRVVTGELNPIPEPATMLLFGTGLAGLAGLGRRKLKKQ